MKYIPGNLDKSLLGVFYYELKYNFNFLIYDNLKSNNHLVVNLNVGDILVVRFYETYTMPYCFLEKVIGDKITTEYLSESIVSKSFIDINEYIFTDITKLMERDQKLSTIGI